MKNITKISLSILTATLIITGCSDSSETVDNQNNEITVERGPIIGAYVVDSNGKRAVNLGYGKYKFSDSPLYPISSYGGYIDVNRNGIVDENDTQMKLSLSLSQTNRDKITILTTLANLDDDFKNEILTSYGLSEEEFYTLTPSTSLIVSAISDEVFKYCIENNSSIEDIKLENLQSMESNIKELIAKNELSSNTIEDIATQNEILLIDELNISLSDIDANLTLVNNEVVQSSQQEQDPSAMLESMPTNDLTQEQKDGLVFMYQEEKVARDVYNDCNHSAPTKTNLI
ncbi:MAG: hypothetical protein U9Q30_06050 [Campylobacterota bacterium]|nr:hypothetical protein [Campylobacterota bacterium]